MLDGIKMGTILNSKKIEKGFLLELEVGYEEGILLQGHFEDVHVFTERVAEFKTNISSRGKNSVTKYFLVPRQLRKNVDCKRPVSCQKIETSDKIIFIYVVDKYGRR